MMENENKQETETQEQEKEIPEVVKSAQEAAEKLKLENERLEKNIRELKELKAIEALGGKTDAGQQQEEKKEETPKDYLNKIRENL